MNRCNIIAVFDINKEHILMCKRIKEPYKGLYNLVGGKIENDNYLSESYRELFEETGITNKDVKLKHLMNFTYIDMDFELQVFYGTLNKEVKLVKEQQDLFWVPLTEDFTDLTKFAGEGNIYHIIETIKKENI